MRSRCRRCGVRMIKQGREGRWSVVSPTPKAAPAEQPGSAVAEAESLPIAAAA